MGFGGGGGEGGKKESDIGYGGGGGAGAKIEPIAFIMLSEDDAKIFRISEKGDVGAILGSIQEAVPELLDKIKGKTGKHKKEGSSEAVKTEVKEHTEIEVEKGGCFH
jgi:uncharacterized spore protein YtfJ